MFRKVASILMASVVLLSVLNLTVAAHFCHDKVIAVKMTVADQKPHTCGMESTNHSSQTGTFFKSKCCANQSASLKVDSNYSPSYFKNLPVFQKELQFSAILVAELFKDIVSSRTIQSNFSPPDVFPIHSVDLAAICVFRI